MSQIDTKEQLSILALTKVQGLRVVDQRNLYTHFGTATNLFDNISQLGVEFPSMPRKLIHAMEDRNIFERAKYELEYVKGKGIDILLFEDDKYPIRLRECHDAPLALYYKGTTTLNAKRIISIVGTRHAGEYGKELCENFIREISVLDSNMLILSGLAYGVDVCAHKAAIACNMPTIGILAHGLDHLYPSIHRSIANSMVQRGGLLTEYMTSTIPLPMNFVARNRIVAGMADATIVVESAAKGGSLITASLAQEYNRECFAFPGRVGDKYSEGCNNLIHKSEAALITSANDFMQAMNWGAPLKKKNIETKQLALFEDLTPDQQIVIAHLVRFKEGIQINQLVVESNFTIQKLTPMLFELEMKGLVKALVGGRYKLQ